MRQSRSRRWMLAACIFIMSLVLTYVHQAEARRGHSSFHVGSHHGRHRHHRFHRHHHHGLRSFFSFRYYGYPYPYRPYYSYAEPYSPGEHRRFPAFRMPAFFHYPGALAKGEEQGAP